jgi:hypothetical protein
VTEFMVSGTARRDPLGAFSNVMQFPVATCDMNKKTTELQLYDKETIDGTLI